MKLLALIITISHLSQSKKRKEKKLDFHKHAVKENYLAR